LLGAEVSKSVIPVIEQDAFAFAAKLKSLADVIKAGASSIEAASIVQRAPWLESFVEMIAKDAGVASMALGMIPQIEAAILAVEAIHVAAQSFGFKPADWDSPVRRAQDENMSNL
jgi:hypothetical protein